MRLELASPRNLVANIPLVYKVEGKIRVDYIKADSIDAYGIEKAIEIILSRICFIYKVKTILFNSYFNYLYLDNKYIITANEGPKDLIVVASRLRNMELDLLPSSLHILKQTQGKFNSMVYDILYEREESLPRTIIKSHLIELFLKEMIKRGDKNIPPWMSKILLYRY